MSQPNLDPYTAKAEAHNVTPQQKITDLHAILHKTGVAMLTTRDASGELHSRAMVPTKRKLSIEIRRI